MDATELLCEDCRKKIMLLSKLENGPKETSALKKRLGRSKEWSYLTGTLLPKLQEIGLVQGKRIRGRGMPFEWSITPKGHDLLRYLLDPPMSPLKVYFAGGGGMLPVLQEVPFPIPFLLSAGLYWTGNKFSMPTGMNFASETFVDSGAQQFYRKIKLRDYPYSDWEYMKFAKAVGADRVATLDLPLDILYPDGRLTVAQGLRRSVEHGARMFELKEAVEYSGEIVPVLQGYDDPEQWLECFDMYREAGVKSSSWGVGSICMMKSTRLAEEVITAVRKKAGNAASLHVFGLALNTLRKVSGLINTFDTSVWVYWAKQDGACFYWDPRNKRFIHLQARDGKRYDTLSLATINLHSILEMTQDLNFQLSLERHRNLHRFPDEPTLGGHGVLQDSVIHA